MQMYDFMTLASVALLVCCSMTPILGDDERAMIPADQSEATTVVSVAKVWTELSTTGEHNVNVTHENNSTTEALEEVEDRSLLTRGNGHNTQRCRSHQGGFGRCIPYADCRVSFENEFIARSSLCGFSNRRPLVCCPQQQPTYGYTPAVFQNNFFPGFQQNFFQQNPFASSFFHRPLPNFYRQPQQPTFGYQQPTYGGGYDFHPHGFNSNPSYGFQPSAFVRPQQPAYHQQQQQPLYVGQLPSVNTPQSPPNQFGLPSHRPAHQPTRNENPQLTQLNSPYCGLTNATTKRIVGGREAAVGAWPWLALLFVDVSGNGYKAPLCGGALINPTHILTAAHCVNLMGNVLQARRFTIRLGEHDYLATDDGANPVDVDVSRVFSHPHFNNRTYLNDIAIIRMRRPVAYGQGIAPICVPVTGGDDPEYQGKSASVAGWGELYYAGPASSILQEVTLPIQSLDTCKEAFKRTVIKFNENYLCAGSLQGDRDTCRGDSGGPLMLLNDQGRYSVIGVTSFGRRCAERGYPGSYTRVAKYHDWIRSVLSQP